MLNQGEPYTKFHNESTPNATLPTPVQMYNQPQQTFEMEKKMVENCRRTKKLAMVEMITSCVLLVFGIISTGLGASIGTPYTGPCNVGTSIWVPIFGIISAGLGLGALRYGNYNRKCLLIAHFVMCILSSIEFAILIIFTCACLTSLSHVQYLYNDEYYGKYWHFERGVPEALIAFESFILIGALAAFVAYIVSAAFICRYWCSNSNNGGSGPVVVYIPAQISGDGMQAVTLPPGAQVVFLPSNNANAVNIEQASKTPAAP